MDVRKTTTDCYTKKSEERPNTVNVRTATVLQNSVSTVTLIEQRGQEKLKAKLAIRNEGSEDIRFLSKKPTAMRRAFINLNLCTPVNLIGKQTMAQS